MINTIQTFEKVKRFTEELNYTRKLHDFDAQSFGFLMSAANKCSEDLKYFLFLGNTYNMLERKQIIDTYYKNINGLKDLIPAEVVDSSSNEELMEMERAIWNMTEEVVVEKSKER